MTGFAVEQIEPVTLACRNRLATMYTLSPFVWRAEDGTFELMLRAVPRRDDDPRLKIAEIWHGHSPDGLRFEMDVAPVLFPGPDVADIDGCEDPTVLVHERQTHVWYTGWNQAQMTGRLLHASGPDAYHLEKRGIAIESTPPYRKPKEATVVPDGEGGWRMFFEFARERASRIGLASAREPDGPWSIEGEILNRREGHFDDWHLSPGPIAGAASATPVLFYNGANARAQWRIGWVAFDAGCRKVIARGREPLIVPDHVSDGASDVAFASSVIESNSSLWLYYSVSDMALYRATLIPTGD